ncbi:hypothetical protein [Hydrogenophaga sp. SL48]|uniref:hypothetical protein n=1 Tax=Hydrogenophaga sp. SL48 TaxID=2806347 RepID=UPI001F1F551A|nr:hypothetical protein [Hydrogenophaga sp. SL48]UJW79220.1 hypothetical protein IM738_15105 [Hydrogenophaga sp. SL48]
MSHTPSPLSFLTRRSLVLAAGAALAGCGGIPLRSLPRLAQLSGQMLDANPAHFMVALQVDARLTPPAGAVPYLLLKLTPKVAGAFEPVDKKLPLAMTTTGGATLGLDAPGPGRRWLVYSLPPATQAELRRIQATVRLAQAQPGYQHGGSLAMGVEQNDLAVADPALARTKWSTWMQIQQSEGFFEVWNGTPEDIRRLAEK